MLMQPPLRHGGGIVVSKASKCITLVLTGESGTHLCMLESKVHAKYVRSTVCLVPQHSLQNQLSAVQTALSQSPCSSPHRKQSYAQRGTYRHEQCDDLCTYDVPTRERFQVHHSHPHQPCRPRCPCIHRPRRCIG